MKERKQEIMQARIAGRDEVVKIVIPRTRLDVEMQPDIPAYVLATLAFSTRVNGVRRWSKFTLQTLNRLGKQYGDATLRDVLASLLDDIDQGFRPTNPVGILIHRLRLTADTSELTI